MSSGSLPVEQEGKGANLTPPFVASFAPPYYTPGSGEHGPRFLTGGPGATPGCVASKNGWVYMRVQGGFNFLWLVCLCRGMNSAALRMVALLGAAPCPACLRI